MKVICGGEKRKFTLTEREIEVLNLMVKGKSNPQISQMLVVSENTAKAHVGNIMEKLKTANRVETVVTAIKLGLVKI